MRYAKWETPDIAAMLDKRKQEDMAGGTTSANVGAYPVPLGPVLRRASVTGDSSDKDLLRWKRRKKHK
jgi:hypothetical protein